MPLPIECPALYPATAPERGAREILDDISELVDEYAKLTGETIEYISLSWERNVGVPPIVSDVFIKSSRSRGG